jgi:hypothetical protein
MQKKNTLLCCWSAAQELLLSRLRRPRHEYVMATTYFLLVIKKIIRLAILS